MTKRVPFRNLPSAGAAPSTPATVVRCRSLRARTGAWLTLGGLSLAGLSLAGCSLLHGSDDEANVENPSASPSAAGSSLFTGSNSAGRSAGGAPGSGSGTGSSSGKANGGDADDPNAAPAEAMACESLAGLGECGATTIAADIRTVNMLLVIDKSGSMSDEPSGFDVSKWAAIKTALERALGGVAADVNLGLLLYPYSTTKKIELLCRDNCCEVPEAGAAVNVDVGPGDVALPTILNALKATEPGGGTPTAAALARANEYFKTGAGAGLKGKNYVLLATDGGPNCNANNSCTADTCTTNLDGQCDSGNCCKSAPAACLDDVSVTQQIEALKQNGVRTFVVGIPGTENYSSYLNAFALAGGEANLAAPPSYYAVSAKGGVQGLVDVFTGITTQLVRSCTLPLASDPPKLDEVNVAVDCALLSPKAADGSSWKIDTSVEPYSVVLSGPICDQVQASGARRVDIVYGCPTVR